MPLLTRCKYHVLCMALGSAGILLNGCANSPSTISVADDTQNTPAVVLDEADHGCSYFYFLWGRTAELSGKNEEALEAYEKALICDPSAELIVRRIPLLLARLHRTDEAVARLMEYLDKHPRDIEPRMVLAKILLGKKQFKHAAAEYRKIHEIAPQDVTPLLLLSELYLADGKTKQALVTLDEALDADSQSYSGQVLMARLLASKRDFGKAEHHYQEALAINWSASLQLELAEVILQQKKYDKAITLYKDLLNRDEFNEDARIALVHVYLQQNREKAALEELNRLKKITHRPGQVDLTIARLYARKKEYKKAIAILSDIVDTEKQDNAEIRYMLAILHFQLEQYKEALFNVQAITPENEEYEDAIILQVRTLRELGKNEQAIALLESVLEQEKSRTPEMFVLLATMYQLNNQQQQGRKTLVRGVDTYPDNFKLLYEYGLFLDYNGEHQQAIYVMQKVIQLKPEHAAALNFVGYSWADQKIHLENAFEYIQRAARLKPKNGYIQDSLGWIYYRLGKLKEAVTTLEQAANLADDDPAILDHLGDVYLELGRSKDALKAYQKALHQYDDEQNIKRLTEKIRILEQQDIH